MKNSIYILTLLLSLTLISVPQAEAKKKKRQTIDLDGADIDGEIRTPTGDYVLQKSNKNFLPLYEKKREMNREIKKTVHFLR